jgi:hypothetical protein
MLIWRKPKLKQPRLQTASFKISNFKSITSCLRSLENQTSLFNGCKRDRWSFSNSKEQCGRCQSVHFFGHNRWCICWSRFAINWFTCIAEKASIRWERYDGESQWRHEIFHPPLCHEFRVYWPKRARMLGCQLQWKVSCQFGSEARNEKSWKRFGAQLYRGWFV